MVDTKSYIRAALNRKRQAEGRAPLPAYTPAEDVPSAAGSFFRGAARGLTSDFADEIAGEVARVASIPYAMYAGVDPSFVDTSEMAAGTREDVRSLYRADEKHNPYIHLGGDVAGSIGQAVLGGKLVGAAAKGAGALGAGARAVQGAGRAINAATKTGGRLARVGKLAAAGSAAGGIQGAIRGLASEGTLDERLGAAGEMAKTGAKWGAPLGVGFGLAGQALSRKGGQAAAEAAPVAGLSESQWPSEFQGPGATGVGSGALSRGRDRLAGGLEYIEKTFRAGTPYQRVMAKLAGQAADKVKHGAPSVPGAQVGIYIPEPQPPVNPLPKRMSRADAVARDTARQRFTDDPPATLPTLQDLFGDQPLPPARRAAATRAVPAAVDFGSPPQATRAAPSAVDLGPDSVWAASPDERAAAMEAVARRRAGRSTPVAEPTEVLGRQPEPTEVLSPASYGGMVVDRGLGTGGGTGAGTPKSLRGGRSGAVDAEPIESQIRRETMGLLDDASSFVNKSALPPRGYESGQDLLRGTRKRTYGKAPANIPKEPTDLPPSRPESSLGADVSMRSDTSGGRPSNVRAPGPASLPPPRPPGEKTGVVTPEEIFSEAPPPREKTASARPPKAPTPAPALEQPPAAPESGYDIYKRESGADFNPQFTREAYDALVQNLSDVPLDQAEVVLARVARQMGVDPTAFVNSMRPKSMPRVASATPEQAAVEGSLSIGRHGANQARAGKPLSGNVKADEHWGSHRLHGIGRVAENVDTAVMVPIEDVPIVDAFRTALTEKGEGIATLGDAAAILRQRGFKYKDMASRLKATASRLREIGRAHVGSGDRGLKAKLRPDSDVVKARVAAREKGKKK